MNRKKKLLYLITKSNWGGAQKYVYELASTLANEYDVVVAFGGGGVLGTEAPGMLKTKLDAVGIRTIFVPELTRDVSPLRELRAVFVALLGLFHAERPDILHVNSSKAGGEGAFAARLAGIPQIVYTVHGLPENESRPFIQKVFIRIATWLTFTLVHRVITITESDYKRARSYARSKEKVHLIYNGIAPMQFGDGEIIRKAFPPGVKITGTIGELTKNKNQKVLIEEANTHPDMYVALVGDGEERKNLEQLIARYGLQERVKLFGFLPAKEVLKGFDVFALPSIKEGLPYVLLEARMAGLPIVANRVGAVAEILDADDLSEFTLEKMIAKTREVYES